MLRDSAIVSSLFSEQEKAAKMMIAIMIENARKAETKIGLCVQAPSDYPEFAQFLVQKNIDSMSFNPDALLRELKTLRWRKQNLSIRRKMKYLLFNI